ncbi:MAG TPA: ATP-binding cassette domain-containing protein [Acidimicrobiales bacterium]|nr:ATP-binding cassette domain-containing protein [Acidimicrobiales bacterium]
MSWSEPPAEPGFDAGDAVVALRGVRFSYLAADGPQVVFDGLSAAFRPGRLTVLTGPSGSGKSTLLRLAAGLLAPAGGRLEHGGRRVGRSARGRRGYRRDAVAYVFQRPADNTFHTLTLEENVRVVARARAVTADAAAVLAPVGLAERAGAYPGELSGGEQQRAAVALATIGARALLAADEPTAQVDAASARAVVAALLAARRAGVAVVVASHDPAVVEVADDVVDLTAGRR